MAKMSSIVKNVNKCIFAFYVVAMIAVSTSEGASGFTLKWLDLRSPKGPEPYSTSVRNEPRSTCSAVLANASGGMSCPLLRPTQQKTSHYSRTWRGFRYQPWLSHPQPPSVLVLDKTWPTWGDIAGPSDLQLNSGYRVCSRILFDVSRNEDLALTVDKKHQSVSHRRSLVRVITKQTERPDTFCTHQDKNNSPSAITEGVAELPFLGGRESSTLVSEWPPLPPTGRLCPCLWPDPGMSRTKLRSHRARNLTMWIPSSFRNMIYHLDPRQQENLVMLIWVIWDTCSHNMTQTIQ